MTLTVENLSRLSLPVIHEITKGSLAIPNHQRRRKDLLIRYVLENGDARLKDKLEEAVNTSTSNQPSKRKRPAVEFQIRKAPRTEDANEDDDDMSKLLDLPPSSDIRLCHEDFDKRKRQDVQIPSRETARVKTNYPEHNPDRFLEPPSDNTIKSCYRQFYDATSNSALMLSICAVCGRERGHHPDKVTTLDLNDIPSPSRLAPSVPHNQQSLFAGMLLEPHGVSVLNGKTMANVCGECLTDLQKDTSLPPRFSLANGLWIGPVPLELSSLTFPEHLLIAHLYPRVYVFKLFPKSGGGSAAELQRGMRGNVSTYELNVSAAAEMVEGLLMPRQPEVLASLIAITYIGVSSLPRKWLHSMFRVRRFHVARALEWLRINNPTYYGDITISHARLSELPEDDIPDEILSVVRHSTDVGLIDEENGGYVRADDIGESTDVMSKLSLNIDEPSGETRERNEVNAVEEACDEEDATADIIPLQVSGSVDCDLTNVTANELMKWGLANMWKEGKEGAYAIRHGHQPVSDFPPKETHPTSTTDDECPTIHSNFFEKAFPCLYPYGCGGIERARPVSLSFRDHIKWSLQYFDRRFRKHETFPFIVFGIAQRREALRSARIQMDRQTFEREARIISSITSQKLNEATVEEEKGLPISDRSVRLLKKHVHATASRIQGSDQSRYRLRSQIWSTSTILGPPSLWITINPSDLHNPIAQVFASEDIDMDNFVTTLGPDRAKRAKNIADDPYAASKFFHFMISTILETLFQIKVTPAQVKTGIGVFGQVTAYFGTVESQGRGTLHLHMLIWLKDVPSSEEMIWLLKLEEFRQRIIHFIQANFRAYVPGLESAESIAKIPHNKEVGYSRPPHPDHPDYDCKLQQTELELARMEQIHVCKPRRCLVYKQGQLVCKRRAPFDLAKEDFAMESGICGPKRLYGYVNSWVSSILINARCNNDGKFLTNGGDTKNITFYVTSYAAKKQGKNHNISAIMANGYAYHLEHPKPEYVDSVRDQQRLLLFRLVHRINREQELAAPMVMSYLMGWGDVYRSHTYSPIYWTSFLSALFNAFPELHWTPPLCVTHSIFLIPTLTFDAEVIHKQIRHLHPELGALRYKQQVRGPMMWVVCAFWSFPGRLSVHRQADDDDNIITLDLSSSGRVVVKSQVVDYKFRGSGLQDYSVFDFFVNTYEAEITKLDREKDHSGEDDHRGPGRPRNTRVRYLSDHPKAASVHRIVRSPGHRNLPNFIGRWFPRNDDPEIFDYYAASMLLLLKPWRDPRTDLKSPYETWTVAFNTFRETAPEGVLRALSGIQYFHECSLAAQKGTTPSGIVRLVEDEDEELEDPSSDLGCGISLSEEGLAMLKAEAIPLREEIHGRMAIEIARHTGIFHNEESSWAITSAAGPSNATNEVMQSIVTWTALLTQPDDNCTQPATRSSVDLPTPVIERCLDEAAPANAEVSLTANAVNAEQALPPVDLHSLKPDQLRAYQIINWHLEETLAGKHPPPLQMILYGEGGTGKSRVIQTVTEVFARRDASNMLVKAAYTGVAASLIEGKTTHVIGGLSLNSKGAVTDAAKRKLQDFWRDVRYLIIDEYSMVSRSFLGVLARNISIGMEGSPVAKAGHSFGGLNVILCGDLHQFPPVACARTEALYYPIDPAKDTVEMQIGRRIYEEFSTVVILKEQVRVSDEPWREFLNHLRFGRVEVRHLQMLRKLLIQRRVSNPLDGHSTPEVDFSTAPWSDAALITPRHAVRTQWNEAAVRKMCIDSQQRLFICVAHDAIKGKPLSLAQRFALASRHKTDKRRKQKDLPESIHLAIGMKVMVTNNLQTDLDITNGARGVITDIILDPDEPAFGEDPIVTLKHLPACVLVKLSRTRAGKLPGLDPGVIPIQRVSWSMQIKVGRDKVRTVTRTQYPITGAYSFTDYRSQGQTIPHAIVDIAPPPTGKLSLFNLYVALSRSPGRNSLRLLRDFDDDMFLQRHKDELIEEDERLEAMNTVTKDWWERMSLA